MGEPATPSRQSNRLKEKNLQNNDNEFSEQQKSDKKTSPSNDKPTPSTDLELVKKFSQLHEAFMVFEKNPIVQQYGIDKALIAVRNLNDGIPYVRLNSTFRS